jgi:hypothetical protein
LCAQLQDELAAAKRSAAVNHSDTLVRIDSVFFFFVNMT